MYSPSAVQQLIDNALVNQTGTIQYEGVGGQQEILTDINDGILERGVMYIPVKSDGTANTDFLSTLSGGVAKMALVQESGLYAYNPNGSVNGVPAANGGTWELVTCVLEPPLVVNLGSGQTEYEIEHNLNTLYPAVTIFSISNTMSGLPMTQIPINADNATITVEDANNITITFPSNTAKNMRVKIRP